MDAKNLEKLDNVCANLRTRVISNRPFDTEGLLAVLVVMAESIRYLAAPIVTRAAETPKEPQTEQRHL